jgi:flagellar protein FlbD
MIHVTRLGRAEDDLVINAELIETVEAKPDTVITLTTGHKVIVQESVELVVERVIAYKRAILHPLSAQR